MYHVTNPVVIMATALGEITLELDMQRAPVTASHFLSLIERELLQEACFYRVVHKSNTPGKLPTIDVIQGGLGFDLAATLPTVRHEPTTETGLRHRDGALSLARGNAQDATGEFFICIGDQPVLDAGVLDGPGAAGFAAFGHVISGMETVKAIHALPADGSPPVGAEFLAGQFLTEPLAVTIRILS